MTDPNSILTVWLIATGIFAAAVLALKLSSAARVRAKAKNKGRDDNQK